MTPKEQTWKEYYNLQKEIELPAGTAVSHTPVKIRYIDRKPEDNKWNGQTILLLHGIPTWGYLYHQIIPQLVTKGNYRVIAPDFLGHGFSDKRDTFDRSFQDQARMILSLLKVLDIPSSSKKIQLVGHDTGGAVSLILAIEHSHIINKMVIMNSVCYDSFDDDMLDLGHPKRWKSKSVSELTNALKITFKDGISDPKHLTDEFVEGMLAPWSDEEGKLSLLRNASALNANQTMALVDRHGTIVAPTLVLWGEDDPWQDCADGKRLASEIPNSEFCLLKGVSHWLQQDAADVVADKILEHFGT